ncbi:28S ribosomal protein S15, mitochondrial [Melipona quadrifasciata]|uniref:Small ribosomal subunit protein uS15m n=1 Tax=Melipona quadrifasciata TaxID=166423 RepID=A0A0M9A020_9HYME|nr:28S ribosomal protein S15, mitochondrial [Melipona quadrifasciata]
MNSIVSCCKLLGAKASNVHVFGGYLSRGMAKTIDDYKIKWVRPVKLPSIDPRQSGDLGLNVSVKPTDMKVFYDKSKELQDADEIVKKMFTLEFQPRRETKNLEREKVIALVKRHICDRNSAEVRIAAMTTEIQYLQRHIAEQRKNVKLRVFLKELIDKRKKFLKYIRRWDYKRFEWLLERLNLIYIPQPKIPGRVSRKDALRQLTKNYCDNIIQQKLNIFKAQLKERQKVFFAQKIKNLEYILAEEQKYGLKPTVSAKQINNARKKLEEILKETA